MAPSNTPAPRTPQTRPGAVKGRRGSTRSLAPELGAAGKAYNNTGKPNARRRTQGFPDARRPR